MAWHRMALRESNDDLKNSQEFGRNEKKTSAYRLVFIAGSDGLDFKI
jgi:hypothetical protein